MSTINDGGPAFPLQSIGPDFAPGYAGMTLRDYFAAKAMQAMLSGHFAKYGHEDYWPRPEIAAEAYEMADAMLAARKPDPQQ